MAGRPQSRLEWRGGCPDCGRRVTPLPPDPIAIPDDFDWGARDFEGFRRAMMEDLAAADPAREKWTEGDIEIMLVELLASALDRSSHALDDMFHERFLETARRPASIVRLLAMIDGRADAEFAVESVLSLKEAQQFGFVASDGTIDPAIRQDALETALRTRPDLIGLAKAAGKAALRTNIVIVTERDCARALEQCPIVAQASVEYSLAFGRQIYVAHVLLDIDDIYLRDRIDELQAVDTATGSDWFNAFRNWFDQRELLSIPQDVLDPDASIAAGPGFASMTLRTAIERMIEPFLPMGAELRLRDGKRIGLYLRLCVNVAANRYVSEMRDSIRAALAEMFAYRSWNFGQKLFESDLIETLAQVDGVTGIVIGKMQLVGRPQMGTASVTPHPDEALVFDIDDANPDNGYLVLDIHGGRPG